MARTVRTKVYKFNELSEAAKTKALDNWSINTEYFRADEVLDSMKQFADHLNGRISDYSIDWNSERQSSVMASFDPADYEDEPVTEAEIKSMGDYDPITNVGFGDCVFTGVCFDENAADGARKLFFSGITNRRQIIKAGIKSLLMAAQSDYEYQQTMEFFSEHADANEYEFTQDGRRF